MSSEPDWLEKQMAEMAWELSQQLPKEVAQFIKDHPEEWEQVKEVMALNGFDMSCFDLEETTKH